MRFCCTEGRPDPVQPALRSGKARHGILPLALLHACWRLPAATLEAPATRPISSANTSSTVPPRMTYAAWSRSARRQERGAGSGLYGSSNDGTVPELQSSRHAAQAPAAQQSGAQHLAAAGTPAHEVMTESVFSSAASMPTTTASCPSYLQAGRRAGKAVPAWMQRCGAQKAWGWAAGQGFGAWGPFCVAAFAAQSGAQRMRALVRLPASGAVGHPRALSAAAPACCSQVAEAADGLGLVQHVG